jgi:multiple sugar transport system permease protein
MSMLHAENTHLVVQTRVGVSRHRRVKVGRIIAWAGLVVFMLVTLFPFYWMLRTAFSTTNALSASPGSLLPVDFTFGAVLRVLGLESPAEALAQGGSGASMDFFGSLRNSLVVSTMVTVVQTTCCALAGFAFARLRWPGRNAVFFAFVTALMIPPIFTTLPNFVMIRDAGLFNTYLGITLPTMLMAPFSIFFLRQFFLGISREVEEAAMIDGAGYLRRFWGVVVPMSSGPITTLALLTFIGTWNDYMWPLLVAPDPAVRTLTVALGVFRSQTPQTGPDWAGLMAAALIAAVPIVVLYLVLGKRIINSIGFSGIK